MKTQELFDKIRELLRQNLGEDVLFSITAEVNERTYAKIAKDNPEDVGEDTIQFGRGMSELNINNKSSYDG